MLKSCQVVPLCQVTSIFSKASPAHFAGGPVSNVIDTYLEQKKKQLSDPEQQNVCDTVNYSDQNTALLFTVLHALNVHGCYMWQAVSLNMGS